jgi:hypothetical protein
MRPPPSFAVIGLLLLTPALYANPLQKEPSDRALRGADNPMRVIIEAAKVKRGPRSADTNAPANASIVATPSRGKPPAASSNLPLTVITAPAKSSTKAEPKSASPEEVATPRSSSEENPAPTTSLLETVEATNPLPPQKRETGLAAAEKSTPRLRLLYRVNPVLSEQLLNQIRRETEVPVKLDIDPQGEVYRVEVLAKVLPGMELAIQNAMRRWRFEPMSDRATTTVVLVFRPDE